MAQERQANLRVMGETQSNGGVFDKVSVMGECKVLGSIDATTCKIMGEFSVSENLTCAYFRNMGEVTISGNLEAKECKLLGETNVDGSSVLKRGTILGELFVTGDLTGEDLNVRGLVHVKGNVSLETLSMRGGVVINGLLNCDDAEIILKYNIENYVKEIGSGHFSVKRRHSLFNQGLTRHFRAEIIEGDRVDLEYTEAKLVRGMDVVIGDGCVIDRVEYSGSYHTSGRFKIGEVVHLGNEG
ncbi:MAG: hypothetical protein ABF608_03775 [Sporolactobacillus sp.]